MIAELRRLNKAYTKVTDKLITIDSKEKLKLKRLKKKEERLFNLINKKLDSIKTNGVVMDYITDIVIQELLPHRSKLNEDK